MDQDLNAAYDLIRTPIRETVSKLRDAGVKQNILAELKEPSRFLFFKTKTMLVPVIKVWRLGVLLLDENGNIYESTNSTRSAPPGHPGHTSLERERHRALMKIAFESGFETGEVIHFDATLLTRPEGLFLGKTLKFENGELKVNWNPAQANLQPIPFKEYVLEQLELRL